MPKIKIERVISVSSEDNVHKAENILSSDTNKKWKCKESGEKSCWVILQLAELTKITGIDIGNEHSAFIEIYVGRTGFNDDEYKTFLMMSSFMTPMDSRKSENINRIRMFTADNFCKPICDERWDRIKIVCTQPFNKHVQYGLSFITLHSISTDESSKPKIGKFAIKPEMNDTITPGSLFHSIKNESSPSNGHARSPVSCAAAIREASLPTSIDRNGAPKLNKFETTNSGDTSQNSIQSPIVNRNRTRILYDDSDSEPNEKVDRVINEYKKIKESESQKDEANTGKKKKEKASEPKKNKESKKPNNFDANASSSSSSQSDCAGTSSKRKKSPSTSDVPKKKVRVPKTKPFGQLMEGVVFVMSGYQNPQRANIRSMALQMGAKYKPDWGSGCTHLVCAFKNTPKYSEVRGRGKIVTSDWIVESHNRKRRLPWRRFALNKRDQDEPESEEEIVDKDSVLSDDNDQSESSVKEKRYNISSGSDTEDEIQRVLAMQAEDKRQPVEEENEEQPMKNDAEDSSEDKQNDKNRIVDKNPPMEVDESRTETDDDIFNKDTDLEDNVDAECPGKIESLPDFFGKLSFCISDSLDEEAATKLKRYIFAYSGKISEEIKDADYLVTCSKDSSVIENFPNVKLVHPGWIWECSDRKLLANVDKFLL